VLNRQLPTPHDSITRALSLSKNEPFAQAHVSAGSLIERQACLLEGSAGQGLAITAPAKVHYSSVLLPLKSGGFSKGLLKENDENEL
jgi:hypothetical protein